jgi:hypothetical protein
MLRGWSSARPGGDLGNSARPARLCVDGCQVATVGRKRVKLFDVASCQPSAWTLENDAALEERLDLMPGPLSGLSWNPDGKAKV